MDYHLFGQVLVGISGESSDSLLLRMNFVFVFFVFAVDANCTDVGCIPMSCSL